MRRDGDRAVDEATVVQAVVHARLLGVRLLTLDARVVVAPAGIEPTSQDLMTPLAVDDGTDPPSKVVGPATPAAPALVGRSPLRAVDGGVSRARELLAEGTQTLARADGPA